eukprot:TRINITY_DN14010_c1_g1_i1.p1 TRINITY_DN14010_c1_g1~~TRINITY_DN14010_c1_g1_i1.p1  ORF type:complete len:514 (+),score=86.36 TRINITY_DN14010_c1_g1_i1:49-1590(+)
MSGVFGVPLWLEGTSISVFGSTLTALGLVLQKRAHGMETSTDSEGTGCTWSQAQVLWALGLALFLLAQIINMVSMAMTPQMILSCLGAYTLVCNCLLARLILGELISCSQGFAVAGLLVSTVLVVVNAPKPAPGQDHLHTVKELSERFGSLEFETLAFSIVLLLLTLRLLSLDVQDRRWFLRRLWQMIEAVKGTSGGGSIGSSEEEMVADTVVDPELKPSHSKPIFWCVTAASCSGFTSMTFKCVAEMIASATDPKSTEAPWRYWQAYAMLLAALCCGPGELHCLNVALKHGDATHVVPMYLALAMLFQLLAGVVFFQELEWFTTRQQVAEFLLSASLVLLCVVAMARAMASDAAAAEAVADAAAGDESLCPDGSIQLPDGLQQNAASIQSQLGAPQQSFIAPLQSEPAGLFEQQQQERPGAQVLISTVPESADSRRRRRPSRRRPPGQIETDLPLELSEKTVSFAGFGAAIDLLTPSGPTVIRAIGAAARTRAQTSMGGDAAEQTRRRLSYP